MTGRHRPTPEVNAVASQSAKRLSERFVDGLEVGQDGSALLPTGCPAVPDQPSRYVAFESLSPSVAAQVEDFVLESNRIEGISVLRAHELEAHTRFLGQREITVADMCTLVKELAGASLRSSAGMDVRVGPHLPPPGGPKIEHALKRILLTASTLGRPPYEVHCEYESLHPFMDGNGRSGRALWAWMMLKDDRDPFALPFLQRWYYESLNAGRVRL